MAATNGIKSFFAERVQTKELCVEVVSVTPDQFAEVFGGAQSAAAAGAQPTGGSSGAPGDASAAGDGTADTAIGTTAALEEIPGSETLPPSSTEAENEAAPEPPVELEASNDNAPPEQLSTAVNE